MQSIHSAASQIRCFLSKDQQPNQKNKDYAKGRQSLNAQPVIEKSPIALLLPLLPLLFLCNIRPDPLATKMSSHSGGGCLADLGGDSSFVLLTRSVNC